MLELKEQDYPNLPAHMRLALNAWVAEYETLKQFKADAQATIADLQGQVEAAQAERDEQGQLKARLNRDYNLLQNEHLKLREKIKQEAVYTKDHARAVRICRQARMLKFHGLRDTDTNEWLDGYEAACCDILAALQRGRGGKG